MGRKGKYEEWRIRIIEQVLALTGCDKEAYEAADISHTTYHRWQNEKDEFRERVARAKREYASINDEEVARQFRTRLMEAMAGPVEVWETEEVTTLPTGEEVVKKTKKKVKKPPAKWAFDIAAPQVGERFGLDRSELSGPDGGAIEISVDDMREDIQRKLSS